MQTGEIRAILRPVIRAVEYLHRQGIVHRDLKPENILIHHEETPKVTDFGIAVLDFAIGSLTRTGRALGTPGYVAPEQQYGLKVDERADQFSLAALAYEMATGRKPLGAFPPPVRLNPRLGPEAAAAILQGPERRPRRSLPDDRRVRRGPRPRPGASPGGPAGGPRPVSSRRPCASPWSPPSRPVAAPGRRARAAHAHRRRSPRRSLAAQAPVARSVGHEPGPGPGRGSSRMGSPAGRPRRPGRRVPGHRVRISRPFYLGETEVTVGQFREFVEATGYRTKAETDRQGGGGSCSTCKPARSSRGPS